MDNAFQELDYSDISAKNLSNKKKHSDINTKTRGGIIRLGSVIIIGLISIILIIALISKSNALSNLENDLDKLKETIKSKEQEKLDAEEKNSFLETEILDSKKTAEKLSKLKNDLQTSIDNLEKSTKKSKEDIKNAQDSITMLEGKLKEFEDKKAQIAELQKQTDYYHNEIEKLQNQ